MVYCQARCAVSRVPGRYSPIQSVGVDAVSPGYFRTLGIPVRGRDFTEADGPAGLPVVIVNQTFARRYFPDVDPIWEFGWRFAPALTIGGGTAEIQRNIIAERTLGLPAEPGEPPEPRQKSSRWTTAPGCTHSGTSATRTPVVR